ncbi:phosphatase PAP2 family protein [Aliivibrio logei]|uniref:phosphatase PAP2 family protein n=1 Tax=Aliivibrio logei TaxID=688 RepID=UPI0003A4602A|nr:phosphatase PAP2 family protein [Aliivibrio logei]
MIKIVFRYIILLCVLFSTHIFAAEGMEPKGAVCVIDDGHRVVLIKELITGKYSLPGGLIDKGETPQQAAEREAWEEAGLIVTAKDLLYKDDKAFFYRCKSESDIVVFDLETSNGFYRVPAWFAPHYGIETDAVYLTEPYKLGSEYYRYPYQLELLQQWIIKPKTSYNKVAWVKNLVEQAPEIHQTELSILSSLRSSIDGLPNVVNVSIKLIFTVINETGQEAFFYFLFIFALVYFDRRTALALLFGIVITIVFAGIAKQGLGLPRPFVYIPQLQLTPAYGFGMPSMNSMLSVVMYGIFYLALKRENLSSKVVKTWGIVFICFVLAQATARVWLGVHFITDAIVGIALGAMVVVHFSLMEKRHGNLIYNVISSVYFWLIMSVLISGIAFVMLYMNYLYMAAVCWGVTLAISLSDYQKITTVRNRLIVLISLIMAVVAARWMTEHLLNAVERSSESVLIIKASANFTLIFLLVMAATYLPKWLNKIK